MVAAAAAAAAGGDLAAAAAEAGGGLAAAFFLGGGTAGSFGVDCELVNCCLPAGGGILLDDARGWGDFDLAGSEGGAAFIFGLAGADRDCEDDDFSDKGLFLAPALPL